MKRALITGITGQDGSYLAEFLLSYDDLSEYTGDIY
jgi:GDP-D-mannose dehydratase